MHDAEKRYVKEEKCREERQRGEMKACERRDLSAVCQSHASTVKLAFISQFNARQFPKTLFEWEFFKTEQALIFFHLLDC